MKVAFHTLGCKVNSYETQAVLEQFKSAGWEIADYTQPADVYVINTCSVTSMAEHKSRQLIHRAKKRNPGAIVVATGCYAQRAREELLGDSGIDLVVGNNHKSEIVRIVSEYIAKKSHVAEESLTEIQPAGQLPKSQNNAGEPDPDNCTEMLKHDPRQRDMQKPGIISDLSGCRDYESQMITENADKFRAFVKIQDGCNRFCSYCIIPYVRGRSRCRNEEEIFAEIRTLAENGYKEIVLTGIDISMYDGMASLLEYAETVPGIERVRLGSLEAGVVTEEFIERASHLKKLCPHFHLSLQSGCNATLKRMNRHYTTDEFAAKIALLRQKFASCAITTDIIVGFPGETDEEFDESMAFVKSCAFSQAHVFKYSRREGTVADRMKDQVSESVKNERSARMISLCDEMSLAYAESMVGLVRPVLIEEEAKTLDGRRILTGFTPEYLKAGIVAGTENNKDRIASEEKPVAADKVLTNAYEVMLCGKPAINTVINVKLSEISLTANGRVILGIIQ